MSETCPKSRSLVTLGSMIASYGSKNPIANGGGRIFDTSSGPYFEYTVGAETDGQMLELYRTHLSDDLCVQFERLLDDGGLEEMCECMDVRPEIWSRKARGRLSLRAQCVIDLANHFGWEEIDSEPVEISEVELHLRWFQDFNLEGPVTPSECRDPRVTVPMLLLSLRELDMAAYDQLFSRSFPLIPSAAMQDSESSWWEDMGARVEAEVISMLQSRCPQTYVFSWDAETQCYGFWPVDGS